MHEDAHDVFVLQAFGTKRWDVWDTRPPGSPPAGDAPPDEGGPVISAELRPGDAMYMPRRTPHAARTQETLSGHLTVGILASTWRDVLSQLVEGVLEAVEFDQPLPAGYHDDRERFAGQLEGRLSEAVRRLEKVDARGAADGTVDRFLSSRPALLRGGLVARPELESVGDHTVVRRRSGSICELRPGGNRLTVLLGDRALAMPAGCEAAIRTIADRDHVRVGELEPYLDEAGRLVLVRRLIREGLLEVVGGG